MKCSKLLLLAFLGLVAAGCATTRNTAKTESASVEWRLKSLEESFLNFRENQRTMMDADRKDRERTDQRLTALEKDLAALRTGGAMGDAQPAARSSDKSGDEAWATDLKPDADGWVEGKKPEPVAKSGEERPWAQVPTPPKTVPEPQVVNRPKKKAVAKPQPKMSGSRAMYEQALAKYNRGDFKGARDGFDRFLKKYPNDKLAPNALYWRGETYYSEKQYPQAILAFKDVSAKFPKHDKAAAALLKIGMSYERVGDRDNAVFYLRALVDDLPDAPAAGLARRELKRLGG